MRKSVLRSISTFAVAALSVGGLAFAGPLASQLAQGAEWDVRSPSHTVAVKGAEWDLRGAEWDLRGGAEWDFAAGGAEWDLRGHSQKGAEWD